MFLNKGSALIRRWSRIFRVAVSFLFVLPGVGSSAMRTMTAGQFPLTVGSRWVYAVHDSISGSNDTVHVMIIGTTRFAGGKPATLWQYRSGTSVDTQYVVRSGDTIRFYRSSDPGSITLGLVFPLSKGRTSSVLPPGTTRVQNVLTAKTPAGAFRHSFEVSYRPAVRNLVGGTTYTVAPRVGIVRISRVTLDTIELRRERTLWQLLSWSIAR